MSVDNYFIGGYEMGYDNGSTWTDTLHPSPGEEGSKEYMARRVLAGLNVAGLVSFANPKIDNAYWEPGGTYMEMWSSAGDITTQRIARGITALGTTYPHWTTVFGVEIDGAPAEDVQIVNGRIRAYPISGTFNSSTVIDFMRGNCTGQMKSPQDAQNQAHQNIAIVDVGQPFLPGIPVQPRPTAATIASTL